MSRDLPGTGSQLDDLPDQTHGIGQFAAARRQIARQASFLPNLHAPDIQRLAQIIVGARLPAKTGVQPIEMRRVYQSVRGQARSYAFGRSESEICLRRLFKARPAALARRTCRTQS